MPGVFPTTRWTLILEAKDSPEARRAAWTQLLATYWRPLYVFFRAKGLDARAAEDAVQDFCVRLLEGDALARLDPSRGRLRGFLKVSAENWLIHQYEKQTAQKRGSGAVAVPIDAALAERLVDPAATADLAWDRAWAMAVFERALAKLEADYSTGDRSGSFALVASFFSPGAEPPGYREAAAKYGMSVPQLKSFLHRARLRFRAFVEEEVKDTTHGAEESADEVRALLTALGGPSPGL